MNSEIRVKICIPRFKDSELFCLNSVNNLSSLDGFNFKLAEISGNDLTHIRNTLLSNVDEFDLVLLVDSDIQFSPTDFLSLNSHNLPVVWGAYPGSNHPENFSAGYFKEGVPGYNEKKVSITDRGTIEVDWAGSGFVLFRTECLQRIQYPYFRKPVVKFPDGEGFKYDNVSDDFGLCMYLKENGEKIMLDCDVNIKQVAPAENGFLTFKVNQENYGTILTSLSKAPLPLETSTPLLKDLSAQAKKQLQMSG